MTPTDMVVRAISSRSVAHGGCSIRGLYSGLRKGGPYASSRPTATVARPLLSVEGSKEQPTPPQAGEDDLSRGGTLFTPSRVKEEPA